MKTVFLVSRKLDTKCDLNKNIEKNKYILPKLKMTEFLIQDITPKFLSVAIHLYIFYINSFSNIQLLQSRYKIVSQNVI